MNGLTRFPLSQLSPILSSSFSPPGGRFFPSSYSFVSPPLQRPRWPLAASHVAMEGHPHVRPCLPVPSSVQSLVSSLPDPVPPDLRSNHFPPLSLLRRPNPSESPLPNPDLPPPPSPPPPQNPSQDSCSAAACLISFSSSSAPRPSSAIQPIPSSSLSASLPSAAIPPSNLPLNSATVSSTVISSHTSPLNPPQSSSAAISLHNLSSSSATTFSSAIPVQPLLSSQLRPSLNPSSQNRPQPLLPAPPAPSSQLIPPVPPRSGPSSRPLPAVFPHSSVSTLHQPSYALVTRGPRGSGFVRSHASDVESFARLPRTGVNIICGSRGGLPSFSFVNSDLPIVEGLYSKALVMKFHGGRPSLESSHKELSSWGIEKPFSIGPLSSRSFLLRFQDEQDLLKVLSRPSSSLITFPYRVFRWHNLCHLKEDSCLAPVWISLPRLPLQCFIPEFLESVANKIGRFLCLDKATATLARPSAARLCLEIDLRKPPPQFIWIGLFEGFKQQIIYEKLPKYCNGCCIQGHSSMECSKGSLDNPHFSADGRNSAPSGSTPHVRFNSSTKKSSSNPQNHIPPPPTMNNPTSTNTNLPIEVENPAAKTPHNQPSPHDAAAMHQPSSHNASDNQNPVYNGNTAMVTIQARPPSPPNVLRGDLINATVESDSASLLAHHSTAKQSESGPSDPMGLTTESRPEHRRKNPSKLPSNSSASHLKHSNQSAHRQSTAPQHKSVAIEQQQSNIEANQVLWEAVNRQVAILEQARLKAPAVDISSISIPNPPAKEPPHQALPADPHTTLPEGESVSGSLEADNQFFASKSSKFMPFDVGNSQSLPQAQAIALERFKRKILEQNRVQGKQLNIPNSVNQFEALLDDQSDEDDYVASYNSDTDDGSVEPLEMGYQSADGRSSYNHKDIAPSSMKINKRHPNMPLNVRLRSRKSLYPSTP